MASRVVQYSHNLAELEQVKNKIVNMIVNGLEARHVDSIVRHTSDHIAVSRAEYDELTAEVARLRGERGDELFSAAMTASGRDRIDLLRRAVEVNPARADAHGELGRACLAAGDHDEAIRHLTTALEREPDSALWWRELGEARAASGDLSGARDAFREAGRIAVDDTASLVSEARLDVLLAGNADDRARALSGFRDLAGYLKYLAARKPDPATLLGYAEALAYCGDLRGSVDAARAGLSSGTRSAEPVHAEFAIGWLPADVSAALKALVAEYEKASA